MKRPLIMMACLFAFLAAPAALAADCITPADKNGNPILPGVDCEYVQVGPSRVKAQSLDLEKYIRIEIVNHSNFEPNPWDVASSDGKVLTPFYSTVTIRVIGSGPYAGLDRIITIPADSACQSDPTIDDWTQSQTVSSAIYNLIGSVEGDSDFDHIGITAGVNNGYLSSGTHTITKISNGFFRATGYFEVNWSVSFAGSADGALKGLGGEVSGTVVMQARAKE
ncbi:MAG: hypothetical protein QNK37_16035 [Acidobacteriota bacterium]|nr:hypothetical protein [Acidobacteriota bacterium]